MGFIYNEANEALYVRCLTVQNLQGILYGGDDDFLAPPIAFLKSSRHSHAGV
jgi:hypothetical protein